MIELEFKFKLTEEQKRSLLTGAQHVSTVEFEATGVRDVHPMADGKSYQRLRRLAREGTARSLPS